MPLHGETEMKSILTFLFIAVCIWSLFTSFTAIIRIWTNEIKGSKVEWTAIAMIGFIGPVLWLMKGRKLIMKQA